MLKVDQAKVEKFFDVLDESSMAINQKTKKTYLDSLLLTCSYINGKEIDEELEQEENNLKGIYLRIENDKFNREEIRKAFLIALLKGFKHQNANFNDITPDTIGILFSYFTDRFFTKPINIIDAGSGTGNLLFSLLNNSKISFKQIYGVDINSYYLKISLALADLLDYKVEFLNQNNLSQLIAPQADLVISDLPVYDEYGEFNLNTQESGITYSPYLMTESLMKYCRDGGYFMYLIPNDFFSREGSQIIKDIILDKTYIQGLIELPQTMFKDIRFQKSIMILRKKAEGLLPAKEILLLSFPSFSETDKVNKAIDKINQWFNTINKE